MSEIRSYEADVSISGKKRRKIVGVIPYNSDSEVLSANGRKFVERIAPGAFNRSIDSHDITAHFSHNEDSRPPLGRTSAKTLRLSGSDEIGLRVWIDAPAWADDIVESVTRGDVRGLSFKFSDPVYEWSKRDSMPVGTIREATLHHVALVVTAAYPLSTVAVRSNVEPPDTISLKLTELDWQLVCLQLRAKGLLK